jgi:fatty acid desaturase
VTPRDTKRLMTHPHDTTPPVTEASLEAADPDWFREPTPREHRMGAALFVAFGVFFVLLFVVLSGWWFRWVILALGVLSMLHGLWHAAASRRGTPAIQNPQSKIQNW